MNDVEIRAEPPSVLPEYATIPISFTVRSRLRVTADTLNLVEEPVEPAYVKDYDRAGTSPLDWAQRWNIARWRIFIARDDRGVAIGGAAVACRAPGPYDREGRDDLAALVDLRVVPWRRGEGIGRALLERASSWARQRGCRELKIETQAVNVAACRFYTACGCRLVSVQPGAYRELPDEAMMIFSLEL